MNKTRLEAFSDGVIAILITIMVTSVFSLALPTGQLEQIAVQNKANQS
jgi:uncharacterized membrane protein